MSKPAPIEGLDPHTRLDEAARRAIAARLADVRRFEERLTASDDADAVHDMRVASRRLRAALMLFERKRRLNDARDAIEGLGDALGEVRELHVQLAWLDAAGERADERERPGIQALASERRAKLPRRLERLNAALGRWTGEGVVTVEEAVATLELRGRLGGRRVRQRLSERLKNVARRLDAAAESPDARTAHRLRIGAKKLRYLAELCQPAFPSEMEALLDRLQALQETLGNLHDSDVHIPIIEKFLVRADGAAQPGALALLRDEMARRDRLSQELLGELHEFQEQAVLEQLRDAVC